MSKKSSLPNTDTQFGISRPARNGSSRNAPHSAEKPATGPDRIGRLVDTPAAERIVDAADGHHPRGEGDGGAGEPVPAALAVEALVVMAGDVDGHLEKDQGKAVLPGNLPERLRADVVWACI